MQIGDLLSELRLDNNLKQKDVAAYLNVSVATISHYESGVNIPNLATLTKLADFFGVSADYLLGRVRIRIDYSTFFKKVRLPDGGTTSIEEVMMAFLELSDSSQAEIVKLIQLYKLGDDMRHSKFMLPSQVEEVRK